MSDVKIESLEIGYGTLIAVSNASFQVAPGEMVALLGPSGCGKTTILRAVAGLLEARSGQISIGGKVVSDPARGISVPPEKRNLGMVFQSYAIWPHMSVIENVGFPLRVRGVDSSEVMTKARQALDLVGLSSMADRPAPDLSGGQQQRVAIARALVFGPNVLLLDEPLSNLDSKLRERMGLELKNIQRRSGVTSLFVTHDQNEALALSDRVIVLNNGVVQQIGTPEEVYVRPANEFVSWFVGRTNFIKGKVQQMGDSVVVSIGQGLAEITCRRNPNLTLSPNQSVFVSLRPEDVDVLDHPAPDSLEVKVAAVAFYGDRKQVITDVDGDRVETYVARERPIHTGDLIRLAFKPVSGNVFANRHEP